MSGTLGVVDNHYIGQREIEIACAIKLAILSEVFLAIGVDYSHIIVTLVLDYIHRVITFGIGSGSVANIVAVGADESNHGTFSSCAAISYLTAQRRRLNLQREIHYRKVNRIPAVAFEGVGIITGMVISLFFNISLFEAISAKVIISFMVRCHKSERFTCFVNQRIGELKGHHINSIIFGAHLCSPGARSFVIDNLSHSGSGVHTAYRLGLCLIIGPFIESFQLKVFIGCSVVTFESDCADFVARVQAKVVGSKEHYYL